MNKRVYGIGTVLAVLILVMTTTSVMASPNSAYFVPQHNSAEPGETVYVELWLNITDPYGSYPLYAFEGADINVTYDSSIGEITAAPRIPGDPWDGSWLNNHWHNPDNWWFTFYCTAWGDESPYGLGPGLWPVANFTIVGVNPGTMDLHFSTLNDPPSLRNSNMFDAAGYDYRNQSWIDGTFTCTGGAPETFAKSLPVGWNLISLPLTATDMTVADVIDTSLSDSYDALYEYDASAHDFVPLSSTDTMENGVGYFIHMTSADTWTYTGNAYASMNVVLSQGLNMVGWLNCTKEDMSDALSSIEGDYCYVARWNSGAQKFEIYNPLAPNGFNDFSDMERGTGYFISAKADDTTLDESC